MTTDTRLRSIQLTEHEFADLPEEEGYRLELSGGRLVREPAPGPRHGRVAFRLLGEVLDGGDVLPGLGVPVESIFEG